MRFASRIRCSFAGHNQWNPISRSHWVRQGLGASLLRHISEINHIAGSELMRLRLSRTSPFTGDGGKVRNGALGPLPSRRLHLILEDSLLPVVDETADAAGAAGWSCLRSRRKRLSSLEFSLPV